MSNQVKTVLGTMAIGTPSLDNKQALVLLNTYKERGYSEIDSAIMYGQGNTEVALGELAAAESFTIATKANPWFIAKGNSPIHQNKGLAKDKVHEQLNISLENLKTQSVDLFYLHAPDHITPIEETLSAVNELYTQGKFKRFGISNYASWQVAQICEICKANNWVMPSVYQGMYNALTRDVEAELFPCLRHYKISFYAYNPLAGGILTGKYKFEDNPKSGRFNGKTMWGKAYRKRFWTKEFFDGVESVKAKAESHNLNLLQASIRWLYHHSSLSTEFGDAVILGVSSIEHLNDNLSASEGGPLPEDLIVLFDAFATSLASKFPKYFR